MAEILIVEDEGVIGMNVELFLNSQGHRVMEIVDEGSKAIEAIEARNPDIVLMDIVLKGSMSGVDTTRIINERYGIPVIFMTAYNDHRTLDRVRGTRHCDVLIKPFEHRQLSNAINKALSGECDE